MKRTKLTALLLTFAMVLSLALAGCGSNNNGTTSTPETSTPAASSATTSTGAASSGATADMTQAAEQLLVDLKGTYEELWPVILDSKYDQTWLDDCKAVVGEQDAEAAAQQMKTACAGKLTGQEAVDAYKKDPDSMAFNCDFTQNVKQFVFDGNKISGLDADGKEVFSHTYKYVEYNADLDFYEYQSEDADSGEFTWFFMRSDTPASTWHIEFRYGSDQDALSEYVTGKYAYWMAAGILTDCSEEDIGKAINLFCEENLKES